MIHLYIILLLLSTSVYANLISCSCEHRNDATLSKMVVNFQDNFLNRSVKDAWENLCQPLCLLENKCTNIPVLFDQCVDESLPSLANEDCLCNININDTKPLSINISSTISGNRDTFCNICRSLFWSSSIIHSINSVNLDNHKNELSGLIVLIIILILPISVLVCIGFTLKKCLM